MPFRVTPYRLEMIADIFCLIGVIFSLAVIFAMDSLLLGIAALLAVLALSYVLYAVAKILRNTEAILEHLGISEEPKKEESDET